MNGETKEERARRQKRESQRRRRAAMTTEQRAAENERAKIHMARSYKNNPEKHKQRNKEWADKNPEKVKKTNRNRHYRIKFGLSLGQYEVLFAEQEGKCLLCSRTSEKALDVDHCHRTKKIRGLLCSYCNRILGHVEKNPLLFESMLRYLEDHKVLTEAV